MATYPPNQTTPGKGSGNYLWNWLGSSLKKFGQAISPYITGGGGEGYKKYVALLSQTASDPPIAMVLENTLGGTPVWTRATSGIYYCTLANTFPADKTVCFATNSTNSGELFVRMAMDGDPNIVRLFTGTGTGTIDFDNQAFDFSVEIRVYP